MAARPPHSPRIAARPAPRRAARASAPPNVANILDVLRRRITTQSIAPGAKLRETDLAQEFGVPRTRIRDALAALEQRGLVERIPNRGAVVMRLDLSQAFHIYDLREVLEALCTRLATANFPGDHWKKDLALFKGPAKQQIEAGDLEGYIEHYERLRRRMIEAAANPVLAEMLDIIYEKTQVLIRRIIILPGRAEIGRRQHVAMLEAMVRGDADEAERLRREGLRNAKAYLERYQAFVL